MTTTHIPAGNYYSKSQAAKALGMPAPTLQWHINKGNINTINFPGLGHLITEKDVAEFRKELEEKQWRLEQVGD